MTFNLLPAALGMSIIVALIAAMILFYVQLLQKQVDAARYWAWAFLFIAFRHLSNLAQQHGWSLMAVPGDICLYFYALALWAGSRCFAGMPMQLSKFVWPGLVLLAWLWLANQQAWPFWLTELPVYGFAAGLLFSSAWYFRQLARQDQQASYLALSLVISLKALHLLDYPFLRTVDYFAPIGFALSSIFDGLMAALLLLASLLRQLRENQINHQTLLSEIQQKIHLQALSLEKQGLFENVFECVPDALLIADDEWRLLEVNQRWCQLSATTPAQMVGTKLTELNLWLDPERLQENLPAMLNQAQSLTMQLKDGDERIHHVLVTARQFHVSTQAYTKSYILMVLQDQSDLIFAQQAQQEIQRRLTEREKLLNTVFQLTPDALTVTEMATGKYIDANRHWGPLAGYRRDEILGKTAMDINIWVDLEQRNNLIETINKYGEVHGMQIAFRHRDGRVQQCRVSGCRFETSGIQYLLLSSRVIDQEIIAETKLRESERKYLSLFQFSPIPLALVDFSDSANLRLLEANDFLLNEFDLPATNFSGQLLDQIPRLSRLKAYPKALQLLIENKQIEQLELEIPDLNGGLRHYLLFAKLIDFSENALAVVAFLNITRQVRAEQEIRELSNQLEERVKARTASLQIANADLAEANASLKHTQDELIRSEKMAALGSLVAGVAHELNTPIGNCVTVASTLHDKTYEFLDLVKQNQLRRSSLTEYAQSASTGMELLMRNLHTARELLRSFKQVAVDQASNQRRQFDLRVFLQELTVTVSPLYKATPYTLELDLAAGLQMDSYPGPLGQILTNLIGNAILHGFEHRTHGQMNLRTSAAGTEHVVLEFEDDGIGMSESVQKRVFDPFFTTKLGRGGSGLGMHIVYNLVCGVLGGTISLNSVAGQGTRFTLRLPRVAPEISFEDAN